jgi:hypothetical protein
MKTQPDLWQGMLWGVLLSVPVWALLVWAVTR